MKRGAKRTRKEKIAHQGVEQTRDLGFMCLLSGFNEQSVALPRSSSNLGTEKFQFYLKTNWFASHASFAHYMVTKSYRICLSTEDARQRFTTRSASSNSILGSTSGYNVLSTGHCNE